jgi:SAM-dependent methyltransferase
VVSIDIRASWTDPPGGCRETLQSLPVEQLLRATANAEARHFWFRGFRRFVGPLLRRAASAGRGEARLLDCGCGTGMNLGLLARHGRACGFDLSMVGLRFGREADRPLVCASAAAAPFPDGTFHVVTSFDVLYGLPAEDETAAVKEMYRVLKPGGYALVNVAAMEILRGDHSVLGHEIRRYDRSSLARLLTGGGFAIERLTYTNATLFLPLAAMRTLQRWRGLRVARNGAGDLTVPPGPVNALLTAVLWAEAAWVRVFDLPFGSSLLCLARKPG